MTHWPLIQSTLEGVFSKATELNFVWEDEPRNLMQKPFGVLSLGTSVTVGRDQSCYTFRDSDITIDLQGYRELTIGVQVFSRQAKGEASSRQLLERARLSLANPMYRDELRSAGLVLIETHPITSLNFSFDQRYESRAAFDVVFSLILQQQQSWPQGGFFDAVELDGSCL